MIGGRTMLRPGFSLVGLEGIVMPMAPQVPPGCLTVLIDWQGQGYSDEDGDLPLFINIPSVHLEPVGDKTTTEEPEPSRPVLGLVRPQPTGEKPAANEASKEEVSREEAGENTPQQKPDDEPEEERPRLRLV